LTEQPLLWRLPLVFRISLGKPYFRVGRTGIRSAAPANLVYPLGEPASPPIEAAIAPWELLRIRGACIGPFDAVMLGFNGSGELDTSVGGTQQNCRWW